MLNLIPLGPGEFSWRDKFQTAEYINHRLGVLREAYNKDPDTARRILSYTLPGLRGRELTDMEIRTRLGLSEGEKIAASLRFFQELERLSASPLPGVRNAVRPLVEKNMRVVPTPFQPLKPPGQIYQVKTANQDGYAQAVRYLDDLRFGVPGASSAGSAVKAGLAAKVLAHLKQHGALTGMGAGIGAGSEAVRSFMNDDPEAGFYSHLREGAKGALRGGAIGAGAGHAASLGLKHFSPDTFNALTGAMFPSPLSVAQAVDKTTQYVNPGIPGAVANYVVNSHLTPEGRALLEAAKNTDLSPALNAVQRAWMHPGTRLAMGAMSAAKAQHSYQNWKEDHRLRQLAAEDAREKTPEGKDADRRAEIAAIKAHRGLGQYAPAATTGHGG